MSEIINYTRLTTSDKLEDRFLTCQVYRPVDPEQAESGMVFSQIEIMNPWFPTSQIGQTIINTLIREYYRGSNTSELVNFENAIKKVNEALAQIAQNGETDWIGKLSGVLVLYNKNEIHFAQTGNSQAYLYRGTKINHITEGLDPDEAPHPLKTFTNITSGTLERDDKIAIANSAFFDLIRPLELRRIVTSFNPTLTAVECAKILKMNGSRQGNAIFLELTTKEELANVPPDQKVEAIYLDQSSANVGLQLKSFYSSSVRPVITKILQSTSSLSKSAAKKAGPKLKQGWNVIQKGTRATVAKVAKKQDSEKIVDSGSQANFKAEIESEEKSGEYVDTEPRKRIEPRHLYLKFKNKLRRLLIGLGFYSRKKSRMILPILIAVVFVFAIILGFSFHLRSKNSVDKNNQEKAAQITTLGNNAIIFETKKDQAQALSDYKQIIALANELKGTKYESQVASQLQNAKNKVKEITKLNPLAIQKTINLDPDVITITPVGDSLITVLKTGEIRILKPGSNSFDSLAKVSLSSDQITSSTYLSSTNTLVFVFSNKTLATFDINSKSWKVQPVKISYAGKISNFGDSIYILDPPDNQIWKLVSDSGKYSAQTPYLKDNFANISDAIDFAIDGNIYTLSNSGTITRFSKGAKNSDFAISLPAGEKINGWDKLSTGENTSSIFAITNESGIPRMVQISKDGNFISQYELEGLNTSVEIAINPEKQTIYVSSGSQLHLYSF